LTDLAGLLEDSQGSSADSQGFADEGLEIPHIPPFDLSSILRGLLVQENP